MAVSSPCLGNSTHLESSVATLDTPTSSPLELDQFVNSKVLGTFPCANDFCEALAQEDVCNQLAPQFNDFSHSREDYSLTMVRAGSTPKEDAEVILANLRDFLDEVHASEGAVVNDLEEYPSVNTPSTTPSPHYHRQDSINADQHFTDEGRSPHAIQPPLSLDSLECQTVDVFPSPCSYSALPYSPAPSDVLSLRNVHNNQVVSGCGVDVDTQALDPLTDGTHLYNDVSLLLPVRPGPLSLLRSSKQTVSSSSSGHPPEIQDSLGRTLFGGSLVAIQVIQDEGFDPKNNGLVALPSPEERLSHIGSQFTPLSSFDELDQEYVFQPLSSSPVEASGPRLSSPVDLDSVDTLDPRDMPLPSSSPPMASSSPPSSSPPTSPFISPSTFWHSSSSSLSVDRTSGVLQDVDAELFTNDNELMNITNKMHQDEPGSYGSFSPIAYELAHTPPQSDDIQTHEPQFEDKAVVPPETSPAQPIQKNSICKPTDLVHLAPHAIVVHENSPLVISNESSGSPCATQMSLPPRPKRATVAAQKLQHKKLARPFRSPIITDNKLIPKPFFLPPPKDARPTAHQETEKQDILQCTANTLPGNPETEDPKIKYRTQRAASQFRSPLAAGSKQPTSLVRLTPNIQVLERKLQVLKRAVKVKADMQEDVLERLIRKWTEAGREVAWEVWDLVKDNATTDEWRESGGRSWEKKRPFEDGWGWDDRNDQKKVKAEEQERHWGWSVVPIRADEDEEVTTADSESHAVTEASFEEHSHGTLGTMLKQLGISPETLGWKEDEDLFVD